MKLSAKQAYQIHDSIVYAEMANLLTGIPHSDFYRRRAANTVSNPVARMLNVFASKGAKAKAFTDHYLKQLGV